jgi:hypothetical protein
MTALPLNGRSYTDLLPIQPGVSPVSTLLPNSVIMAGVTGGLSPSGDLNPGNLSIDGQRESSNGFLVNGIDVQEHMNGGTSIVANLDSIEEFRVLTNNFDPEYGNYNGGMVTVITKSGSDSFHGNVFEFLRNTALDARGYFDPSRASFRQNQFGGTIGGPIKHRTIYFFGDYQGTRTNEGVETGLISVPSAQNRVGNLSDVASSLTGTVKGHSRGLAFARTALWSFRGRTLLHARMRDELILRIPKRGDTAERVVVAGPRAAAIHPFAQQWHRSIFHFGLFPDGT